VLLIVGFLAGFILQYASLQQAQQELSASAKQLASCQAGEQFSQLRDTATVMFLEAVQKNYGKAGEDSKEFFDQAQRIQSSTADPQCIMQFLSFHFRSRGRHSDKALGPFFLSRMFSNAPFTASTT
jgi:hypothetical protein